MAPKIRAASHAGSWYTDDGEFLSHYESEEGAWPHTNPSPLGPKLDKSLSQWLSAVDQSNVPFPQSVADRNGNGEVFQLPVKGCKAIIGP